MPDSSHFWAELLADAHSLHHLRVAFFNSVANKMVCEYIKGCVVCQQNKTKHLHPAELLQPLNVPSVIWEDIFMDFIEGFPKVDGKTVILTIIDRFSKYSHFIPLGHPYMTNSIARAFFDYIVRLHGIPYSIMSDHDPMFTNNFWMGKFFSFYGS